MELSCAVRICLKSEHLHRTGLISIVVGTWLTTFNHIDVLLAGRVGMWLGVKIFLNYATPFVVANAGLLARQNDG